jgi:hypothetical protein
MSQGARNGNENGVEWQRPAGEVVNLEGVEEPVSEADPGALRRNDCCHPGLG